MVQKDQGSAQFLRQNLQGIYTMGFYLGQAKHAQMGDSNVIHFLDNSTRGILDMYLSRDPNYDPSLSFMNKIESFNHQFNKDVIESNRAN